jgi:prostaglandin-H2 D-isomerase / glutathione transferase
VPFEDNRLKREQWSDLKPKTPYGSMPVLDVEGKPSLAQSNAILGYIGRSYGLHPTDPWRAALHEGILQSVEDVRAALTPSGSITDQAAKQSAREEFARGPLATWAGRIEQQIKGPFLEGTELNVADIKLFTIMHSFIGGSIDFVPKTVFEPFARMMALYEAVRTQPKIAAWRAAH